MTLRCEPGDIAVILRGAGQGVFVDVLRRAQDEPGTGAPAWECRIHGPMEATGVLHTPFGNVIMGTGKAHPGDVIGIPDNVLQPIRPRKPPQASPAPSRELEYT